MKFNFPKSLFPGVVSSMLCALNATTAIATSNKSYIDTNRPSFTFSPIVIPKGSVQQESGTQYQWYRDAQNRFSIPETQIRVGLFNRTEFQLNVPNYILLHSSEDTNAGATHLGEVGIKQQFGPLKGVDASLVCSANIPTGRNYFLGSGVQPVFRLPVALPLGNKYQICAMPSFILYDAGRQTSYEQTAMLTRSFGRKNAVFAEYAGFFTQNLPPINVIHFGGIHKFNRNNQVDFRFGFGLNRDAPTAFIGGGYSCRLDKLWH